MRGLCVAKLFGCGIIKIERQPPTAVRANPIGLRLLGHYRMACMNQSAASYGLASWMHPQRWVADSMGQKIRLGERQITEAVFLCLDYCIAKIYECGIIKIERQPPTRWVADSKWKENPPR